MDYNTGWQYSVTGTGVSADGSLTPTGSGSISNTQITLDGVTSTWNGLNLEERPNFTMTNQGGAFQFTETYHGPELVKSHNNTENHHNKFRHRHNFNVHTIINKLCLLLATSVVSVPAYAEVGGISATANPIANSSEPVTNQAIQVLQGPYITNTYGNGIQCQGATMNITPYFTGTGNFKRPFEHTYMDPVYDMSDLDDDGVLDNPGQYFILCSNKNWTTGSL